MRKIKSILFFAIILFPMLGSAEETEIEKYKGFINNYVAQMQSLASYDMDYIRFGKSSPLSDIEHNYINSMEDVNNLNALKESLNDIKARELKNDKTSGITYVTYSNYRLSREGNMNLKVFGYKNNRQIGPMIKTYTKENVFTEDPASNSWVISNDLTKDPTFTMYNPIDTFTSYQSVSNANNQLYNLYLTRISEIGEDFSITKSDDLTTISAKVSPLYVKITIDEKNNCITKIKTSVDGGGQVEYSTQKIFEKYTNIDGIQFPKKVTYIAMVNGKVIDENINIFDKIVINKDIQIEVSEDDIKDGALVEDLRANFTYKKGYPELRK